MKFPRFRVGKKFLVGTGLAIVVAVGGFFVAQGMTEHSTAKTAVKNVAEARYFMHTANIPTAEIQFFAGIREDNYAQDGIAGKAIPFAVVNVQVDKRFRDVPEITGTLRINESPYEIILIKNPIDPLNFTNDISKSLRNVVDASDEIEVTLLIDAVNTPTTKLENCMPEGAIKWDEAIRIATECRVKELRGQKFETYATIMYNAKKDTTPYWYVRFVTEKGDTYYCVVAHDGRYHTN